MNKAKIIGLVILISLIALAVGCGSGTGTAPDTGSKKIGETKVGDKLMVSISSADGKLKNGSQEVTLSFTDAAGKPVDIQAAQLNFMMPGMGSMAEMNNAAELTTTGTPGEFKGKVNIEMAGDWIAQISYEGAETGKTTISVKAE